MLSGYPSVQEGTVSDPRNVVANYQAYNAGDSFIDIAAYPDTPAPSRLDVNISD